MLKLSLPITLANFVELWQRGLAPSHSRPQDHFGTSSTLAACYGKHTLFSSRLQLREEMILI